MLKILVPFLAAAALAACGGSSKAPAAPIPGVNGAPAASTPAVLELGEMTVFDGDQPMLKLHADGTTEMGGQSSTAAGTKVVWKAGPTLKSDGTLSANGEARIQVTADGKVIDAKGQTPLPITVTNDAVTIADGGKSFTIGLTADGKVTLSGGDKQPDKPPHVEGATTPGKRRTVLVLLALMLSSDSSQPQAQPTVSVPAATP